MVKEKRDRTVGGDRTNKREKNKLTEKKKQMRVGVPMILVRFISSIRVSHSVLFR